MKYQQCHSCSMLDEGKCNGPNLSILESEEKIEWINHRMKHLGLTHQDLALRAEISKGTLDPILSGKRPNFSNETLRLILFALGMKSTGDNPCPDNETLDTIKAELQDLQSFKENADKHKDIAIEKTKEDNQKKIEFLKQQIEARDKQIAIQNDAIRRKERTITTLSIIIGVLGFSLIALFAFDFFNPWFGMFRG